MSDLTPGVYVWTCTALSLYGEEGWDFSPLTDISKGIVKGWGVSVPSDRDFPKYINRFFSQQIPLTNEEVITAKKCAKTVRRLGHFYFSVNGFDTYEKLEEYASIINNAFDSPPPLPQQLPDLMINLIPDKKIDAGFKKLIYAVVQLPLLVKDLDWYMSEATRMLGRIYPDHKEEISDMITTFKEGYAPLLNSIETFMRILYKKPVDASYDNLIQSRVILNELFAESIDLHLGISSYMNLLQQASAERGGIIEEFMSADSVLDLVSSEESLNFAEGIMNGISDDYKVLKSHLRNRIEEVKARVRRGELRLSRTNPDGETPISDRIKREFSNSLVSDLSYLLGLDMERCSSG